MKKMNSDGESSIGLTRSQHPGPSLTVLTILYCPSCVSQHKAVELEQNVIQVILTMQRVLQKIALHRFSF